MNRIRDVLTSAQVVLMAAAVYVTAHDPASIYALASDTGWLGGWLAPLLLIAAAALSLRDRRIGGRERGVRLPPVSVSIPAAYFAADSVWQAAAGQVSVARWASSAVCCALALLIGSLATMRGEIRSYLVGATLGTAAIGIEGIARLAIGAQTPDQLLVFSGSRLGSGDPNLMNRLGNGGLPYPTLLASLFVLFGSVSLGLAATGRTAHERFLWTTIWAFNGICVVLTASRAAILVFVLMTLAHVAIRSWRGGWAAATAGVILLGGALKLAMTRGSVLRSDGSLSSRVHMWGVCFHVARAHPLFGGGPGAFAAAWRPYTQGWRYPLYTVPHSTWFGLLADGGLAAVGMASVLAIGLGLGVWRLIASNCNADLEHLALALVIGLAAVLTHDLLENSFRQTPILMMGFILGGVLLIWREQAVDPAGTSTPAA